MARNTLPTLAMLTLLAIPLAAAQDDMTPDVDVNVTETNEPAETTFAGLSTTVVIVLIVLAVLVVALIVAMASRP